MSTTVEAICQNCNKVFRGRIQGKVRKSSRFCSRACWYEWSREKNPDRKAIDCECPVCHKIFQDYPANLRVRKGKERRFCSHACRSIGFIGDAHPLYKGRRHNRAGYIAVRGYEVLDEYKSMIVRGDSVLEHRLVMAMHLGRPLEDDEVVHHKNGIKDDNRLENLELVHRLAHSGYTAVEHRLISQLKRENEEMRNRISELEKRLSDC